VIAGAIESWPDVGEGMHDITALLSI